MKAGPWVPPVVFVATAIPVVLLLNYIDIASDFRIWIAMGCGIAATAFAQSRLKRAQAEEDKT